MAFVTHIFWNRDQGRLRALWRLALQGILLVPILIVLSSMAGFLGIGRLMTQGEVPQDQLTPSGLQALLNENPAILLTTYLSFALSMTLSVWLAGRLFDRRAFVDFGFHLDRDWWIDLGFGLGLGALLMLIVFVIELAAGWITITGFLVTRTSDTGFLPAILVPAVTFIAVGFYEELFSRGYQLQNLAEGLQGLGSTAAIIIATFLSSVVFGVLHAVNPNADLFSILNIIVAGFSLGIGYLLTGELAMPIGLHITWNFFQGNVFGFPVSGSNIGAATFIQIEQRGPSFWTGGAFGPEGGLLGLLAMALSITLTIVWVRMRYGKVSLYRPLADPPARSENTES